MIVEYKDIGRVELIANKRAKRIIVRYRDGMFQLTHPYRMPISSIEASINEMKPRLLTLKDRAPSKTIFDLGFELKTYSFTIKIVEDNRNSFYLSFRDRTLFITCPINTNYNDASIQERIRNGIERVLRNEAKRLFPSWVKQLSDKHKLSYTQVKINKSKTRWGSCSSTKSINLSYYCLLLPEHQIEHIILHELCHTIEMNHSDRFWNLLDSVTGGKAKTLSKELKTFKTSI